MKKGWKRALIALLCLVMMLALVPKASYADYDGVAYRIEQLSSKFPNGKYWNHRVSTAGYDAFYQKDESWMNSVTSVRCNHNATSVGNYDCNYFDGGSQCWGFANRLYFEVFGVRCTNTSSTITHYDKWSIQPGDHVRLSSDHSVFVGSRVGDIIYVIECNYDYCCGISWGREINLNNISVSWIKHANNWDEVNRTHETAPTTYTVSYDANGGTGAPGQQTKTQGKALTLSSTKPSRASTNPAGYTVTLDPNGGTTSSSSLSAKRTTNYTFKNWNTKKDGSGTTYNPGASYTTDANVTLYVQWNSSTTTASVTLPTPWRYGYTFQGWATSSSATSGVTGSYKPSKSLTLYATWAKEDLSGWSTTKPDNIYEDQIETATQYRYSDRTVSGGWTQSSSGTINYVESWSPYFDTSHSLYTRFNKTPKTVGVNGNKKVEASTAVKGWIYWHWCRGQVKSAPTNRFISDYGYTAEFNTFHALYSETDVDHFDNNGVDGGSTFFFPHSQTCTDTYWYWRTPVYRQTYTEYSATSTYSDWSAWSDWTMTRYATSDTRKEDSRTVYRYKSSVKPFAVTFDPNGGSCATANKNVTRGETYGNLPTPTRTGCTFDGWYTAKEGGNLVSAATRATVTGAHTLYARWTNFVVSYDANGGTGAPGQQTKARGRALTLSGVKPSRTGAAASSYTVTLNANGGTVSKTSLTAACTTNYTFDKWNTAKNGSGTAYASGASYTVDAPAALFAQWNAASVADSVVLPNATRDEYAFDGWYTAASGGNRVGGAGDDYTPAGNGTLFAHWSKNHTFTASGRCGNKAYWSLENEVLTISGTGAMWDFSHDVSDGAPWIDWVMEDEDYTATTPRRQSQSKYRFNKLIIEDGITCISDCAFWYCDYLENVVIPLSVVNIKANAFTNDGRYGSDKLTDVYYAGSKEDAARIAIEPQNKPLKGATWHYSQQEKAIRGLKLTQEPQSVTVRNGKKATFTVKTSGKVKSYQWYYRTSETASWKKVKSATKSKLTVTAKPGNNGYQYRCVLQNAYGKLTTDAATLTVELRPPVITGQPKSVTVKLTGKAVFTVTATDGDAFQWYSRTSPTAKWTKVKSGAAAKLTVTPKPELNGYEYKCDVTNKDGVAVSNVVRLTIDAVIPRITLQPKSVTAKKNAAVTFTVEAENAVAFQWYYRKSSGAKWTKIKGATEATYTFKAAKKLKGYQYKCDIWSTDCKISTKAVTLKVK